MFVDATGLGHADTYRFLNGAIVPRPIAWISSGVPPKPTNLAPFSAFTWVSQHPAMIGFTANLRDGVRKDTVRNIEEDGEFVVHIASESLLEELHASSEFLGPEVSEASALGLQLAPSARIEVPRLAAAPIAIECVHERTIEFSPTGGEFVVGRVVGWHVAEDLLDGERIMTDRVRPLVRVGGPHYATLGALTKRDPFPG